MVFIEGTNCGTKSNKFAVPLGRSDVDVNTVTLGYDSKLLSFDNCEVISEAFGAYMKILYIDQV